MNDEFPNLLGEHTPAAIAAMRVINEREAIAIAASYAKYMERRRVYMSECATVGDLVARLSKLPQSVPVFAYDDGKHVQLFMDEIRVVEDEDGFKVVILNG